MNTFKIFRPIKILAEIFGLSPMTQKLTLSPLKVLQTVILGTTCIYLTSLYIWFILTQMTFSGVTSPTIMKFVLSFRTGSFTFLMVVAVLSSGTTFKLVAKTLENMTKIDKDLTELGQKKYLEKRNRHIFRTSVLLIFVMHLMFDTLGGLYSTWSKKSKQVEYFLIHWYPRMLISTKLLAHFLILTVLKARFEAINNIIDSIRQNSQTRNQAVPTGTIKTLVQMHSNLVTTSEEVCDSFSIFGLVWISLIFVVLIGDAYAVLNSVLFQNVYKPLPIVLSKYQKIIVVPLVILQAKVTKTVLLGVKIDICNEEERNSVVASVLQLMENKIEITACRLFNIDNALLFAICGSAFSYLFIMLQFDLNNKKNQSLGNGTTA
ncbi:putative gustatory receptor 28b [Tribolium castaneum]|uniref:putative gustatory receptor 28b n=1 Tax=Tribolium castaneum TaxID=7070 RepID=UPI0030FE5A5B